MIRGFFLAIALTYTGARAATISLDVDATDLPRQLLHAREEISGVSPEVTLWYPKWLPGSHGPVGPIENLGGLRISDADGLRLDWRRGADDPFAFHPELPEGADGLTVELDYICNTREGAGQGTISYGTPHVGMINWNTCLLYPESASVDEMQVRLRLRLPASWEAATALRGSSEAGDWITFEPVSLRTLIDSPLICAEQIQTIDISVPDFPPARLHFAAADHVSLEISEEMIEKSHAMIEEARELYRAAPFEEYDFLIALGDDLGDVGLEHRASCLISAAAEDVEDEWEPWFAQLLAHEMSHAWNGKQRQPAGIHQRDYHTPEDREMLWVYEGLTEYLGATLATRAGFMSPESHVEEIASLLEYSSLNSGRQWRSLADTGLSSDFLRGRSANWGILRRGQDYYDEGRLFWTEADATIRSLTSEERSLDDFIQAFFAPNQPETYTLDEIVATLNSIAPHAWAELIEARIYQPQEEYPLDWLELTGREVSYDEEPTEYVTQSQDTWERSVALSSLGINVNDDGTIRTVIPGSPAAEAGLTQQMTIAGVNGRRHSRDAFLQAVRETDENGGIELLVWSQDDYRTIRIPYTGGARHLHLAPVEGARDRLLEAAKPLRAAE